MSYSPQLQATMTTLDGKVLERFRALQIPENKVQVDYVWIDGTGQFLRSKTRTFDFIPKKAEDLPSSTYGGTGTGQATGSICECSLIPKVLYADPFREGNNKVALCEAYDPENNPAKGNHRVSCAATMDAASSFEPMFGIEQEYVFLDREQNRPLGWPKGGYPMQSTRFPAFCGIGTGTVAGRNIAESHYRTCLYAGLPMWGLYAEGLLGQWEYQIGPCSGIAIGDDLWMSRYLLYRVAEEFDVKVTLDPKPVEPPWLGSGAHTNFSTRQSREKDGLKFLLEAVKKLNKKHDEHLKIYDPNGGEDNKRRTAEAGCWAPSGDFTYGIGDRSTSIRIPKFVETNGGGYLEDRRPASNCDPYLVTEAIVRTVCLE